MHIYTNTARKTANIASLLGDSTDEKDIHNIREASAYHAVSRM